MKIIALIPARKGSKGILNKNMQLLNKLPLVEHTIQAAHNTKNFDEIWISSDDNRILAIGMKYGLNIIERPQELASDEASANDVVSHFLSKLPSNLDKKNTVIVYLQPTSPLRNTKHIQEAIEAMKDKSYTSSISVVKLNKSPYKSFLINPKNGELSSLFDERLSNERRQDLQDVFIPNGAMYIFSIHDFESRGGFPSNGSLPYIMSHDDSIDIDSEQDLNRANDILQDKISSNS